MEMLSAVVLCLLVVSVVVQRGKGNDPNPTKSAWTCNETDVSGVTLLCPNSSDWIRVESKAFSFTGNCSSGKFHNATELSNCPVNCLGPQTGSSGTCNEHVNCQSNPQNISAEKLTNVVYECIAGDLNFNMCDRFSIQARGDSLFLASPNFFDRTSAVRGSQDCRCRVEGFTKARALILAHTSLLNISCENCTNNFLNGIPIKEREIYSQGSYVLDINFQPKNSSSLEDRTNNSFWIQINGDCRMHLQCNWNMTENTTSVAECQDPLAPIYPSRKSSDSPEVPKTENSGINVHIIGAVAGALLLVALVVVIIVVVSKMRRKRQLKKNPAKVTYSSTNQRLMHDADGYCVIDLNQKKGDNVRSTSESKKPNWLKWRQTMAANGTTNVDEPTRLNKSSQETGKDGVTLLYMRPPVAAATKGLTNQGFSNDGEEKKVYHILDPDPDAPQGKDIVFVHVPKDARHVVIQQSGNFSCDPIPQERSVHLYSDVEDIDGASGGEANPVQSLQNPKPQIPRRNHGKEYEDVEASDLQSPQHSEARIPPRDPSSEYQEVIAGSVQLSRNSESRIPYKDKSNGYEEIKAVGVPSKADHILQPDPNAPPENDIVIVPLNPIAHAVTGAVNSTGDRKHKGGEDASGKDLEDDDDDKLVMIDNIVYNSDDPKNETKHQSKVNGAVNSSGDCMHEEVAQVSGRELENDDDELVMIDNIVYNSSDPKSQTQHQHKVAGDCTHKGVEEASGRDLKDDDDELVMIDNILYNSSDPKPQTQHQHNAPNPQRPTSTEPSDSDDDILHENNAHHYSEVDGSLVISRDNPNTPLQTGPSLNGESGTGESGYHHYMDIDDSAIASAGDSKTRPANNGGKTPTTGQYEEIVLTP